MVHRRAFSFTDDSANIEPEIISKEEMFRQASEPARQLFRLRQLESSLYQKVYFTDGQIMKEPWSAIAAGLNDAREWANNLPLSIARPLRALFQSELLYVNVLILSAPGTAAAFHVNGEVIFIETVIQYAEITSSLIQSSEEFAFYTSHDVLRASYIARRFLEVLEAGGPSLFQRLSGQSVLRGSERPRPSLAYRGIKEWIGLAIGTIAHLDKILKHLCVQYGYSEPWREFHSRSLIQNNTLQSYQERPAIETELESTEHLPLSVTLERAATATRQEEAPAAYHEAPRTAIRDTSYHGKLPKSKSHSSDTLDHQG